jgi:hypothetical protein
MVNTYKIHLRGYGTETLICEETAGKAKYRHYLQLEDAFESFDLYLRFVDSCKCLRKAQKEDYFRKDRDFERTIKYRGIPLATYGTEVELNGKRGFIIGVNDSCNLDIKFDNGIFNCHPNYELIYFDKCGNVLYDFRKKKGVTA